MNATIGEYRRMYVFPYYVESCIIVVIVQDCSYYYITLPIVISKVYEILEKKLYIGQWHFDEKSIEILSWEAEMITREIWHY